MEKRKNAKRETKIAYCAWPGLPDTGWHSLRRLAAKRAPADEAAYSASLPGAFTSYKHLPRLRYFYLIWGRTWCTHWGGANNALRPYLPVFAAVSPGVDLVFVRASWRLVKRGAGPWRLSVLIMDNLSCELPTVRVRYTWCHDPAPIVHTAYALRRFTVNCDAKKSSAVYFGRHAWDWS